MVFLPYRSGGTGCGFYLAAFSRCRASKIDPIQDHMGLLARFLRWLQRPTTAPSCADAAVQPEDTYIVPALAIAGARLHGPGVRQIECPNHSGTFCAEPDLVILHYTAGPSEASAIGHMCKADAGASVHFVVGRGGQITQLVPTDTIAWHAGRSQWGDRLCGITSRTALNSCSIGIEIVNAGELDQNGDTWYKAHIYPSERVQLQHKDGGGPSLWHTYTDAQAMAVTRLCRAITECYEITAILGHDDVSPGRKRDPGPAYPIQALRVALGHPQTYEAGGA